MGLTITLNNTGGTPIYEQITSQIKAAILSGDLAEGEALPSIRGLAKDLRVSVITTTRAYSDLAAQGFVTNVPGKGSYVLPRDTDLVREQLIREVEAHFEDGVRTAAIAGLSREELHHILDSTLTTQEDS